MDKIYIITIIVVIIFIIGISILFVYLYRQKQKKKLISGINELEVRRNKISSIPVMSELSKIEDIAKSEQLEEKINDFKIRYQMIKDNKLAKVTDQLLTLEEYVTDRDVKGYYEHYSNIELMLYEAETSMNKIIEEIDEIASYEEKYRDIVIKLKAKFRSIERRFHERE